MADSKCVKCGNTDFEAKLNIVRGSSYKFYFVQCTACGGVVGTHEYVHIGSQLDEVKKKIDQIQK